MIRLLCNILIYTTVSTRLRTNDRPCKERMGNMNSVAKAAVYRRIGLLWNRLLRVIKLLGGWPKIGLLFIHLPFGSSFFFKFANFLSIQRIFGLFQCLRKLYSSISGIKSSCRATSIDYPLHAEVNNLIVFPPNWVILIILLLKSAQIWKIGRIIA